MQVNEIILSVIVVMLMIGAQSAYAETAYQSGFNYGIKDAKTHDVTQQYILQPGKGFKFHSWDFNHGYVAGFCSIVGPSISSDADEAGFDCARGPESAFWVGN